MGLPPSSSGGSHFNFTLVPVTLETAGLPALAGGPKPSINHMNIIPLTGHHVITQSSCDSHVTTLTVYVECHVSRVTATAVGDDARVRSHVFVAQFDNLQDTGCST